MRSAGLGLVLLIPLGHAAPVLHEPVEVGLRCQDGLCFADSVAPTSEVRAPVAIEQDGRRIAAPEGDAQLQNDEPIFFPGVPGTTRADLTTTWDPNQKMVYHELFNPSVYPMERMKAFDQISADEVLSVHDPRIAPIKPTQLRAPGRDAFWGSALIEFEAGKWVPIPSPAADLHILHAASTPPSGELQFGRDSAENLFVSSPISGKRRITWLADAAQSYFAGSIPSDILLSDEPAPTPLPPAISARARTVLERLHLHPQKGQSLRSILDPMVAYFRSFQEGALTSHSDSTYLDLALSRRGVCRHRSFAFVVTALALGIPARYVQNELHVFVEVWIPRAGWRQINLGGALADAELAGAEHKAPYTPKGHDPLPNPPAFASTQIPRAHFGGSNSPGSGRAGGDSGSDALGSALNRATRTAERVKLDLLTRRNIRSDVLLQSTAISVQIGTHTAFRGDPVEVSGSIRVSDEQDSDGDARDLSVELYLEDGDSAVFLGETRTTSDGSFHVMVTVPRALQVGDHRLIARTPGDARRSGALTR